MERAIGARRAALLFAVLGAVLWWWTAENGASRSSAWFLLALAAVCALIAVWAEHAPKRANSDLAQLAELHRHGDLSDEEFDAAKRRLLG